MTCDTQFQWTSASRSHIGLVREINEDACLDLPERGLWAVADGMGGHALGDLASGMVIACLSSLPPHETVGNLIADARRRLQAVNRQLRAEAAIRDVHIIGSTVIALLACGNWCGYLWAGDSRLYLYRSGRLALMTQDHSQVEELKAQGSLSAEDALHHPARNLITRAIGAMDTLDLDEKTMEVIDGDMFLLCSDGLSNDVTEPEMCDALATGSCRQAVEVLVDIALTRGGHDNISTVVIRAEDPYSFEKTVLNPSL